MLREKILTNVRQSLVIWYPMDPPKAAGTKERVGRFEKKMENPRVNL